MSVYLIQCGKNGPIKIGVSEDPAARLAMLQTATPEPLRLVCIIPQGIVSEGLLHGQFAALRIRGEWFRAEGELLEFASRMAEQFPPPGASAKPKKAGPKPREGFAALCQAEPRLRVLYREAQALHKTAEPGTFCANAVWYGYDGKPGLQERLALLVGWDARISRLRNERAYDIAYDTIYDALPDCDHPGWC